MTAIEYREFEGAVALPLLNQLASVAWQVFSEKGDLESFTKGFIELARFKPMQIYSPLLLLILQARTVIFLPNPKASNRCR